jgi:hypothetical protein
MPRFQRRLSCDTGYPDGQIFIPVTPTCVIGATGTQTRSAAGHAYTVIPASSTAYVELDLTPIFRTGLQDDFQEIFGGSGSAGSFASANGLAAPPATFSTPGSVSGAPPFTGISQLSQPTSRPKGVQINSLAAAYTVVGTAVTTNTLGLYKMVFANNTAPALSTLLAATSLATAVQTNPYLTTLSVSSPAYQTSQNANYILEWTITTPADSTVNLYGVLANVTYNFN